MVYEEAPKSTNEQQILEVFEITNIEDTEITYEDAMEEDENADEHFELVNIIHETETSPSMAADTSGEAPKERTTKKRKLQLDSMESKGSKTSTPKLSSKNVDDSVMEDAINEIMTNSSR